MSDSDTNYMWHTVTMGSGALQVDVWLPEDATEEQLYRAACKRLGWACGPHVVTIPSSENKDEN